MSLYTEEGAAQRRRARAEVELRRALTEDEELVLTLIDSPAFLAFVRIATDRGSNPKSALYLGDLSQKEFLAGRNVGELKTLDWLVNLPTTLLKRKEKSIEKQP